MQVNLVARDYERPGHGTRRKAADELNSPSFVLVGTVLPVSEVTRWLLRCEQRYLARGMEHVDVEAQRRYDRARTFR